LHLEGIDSVVVERQSRAHVEARIRAGVLEHGAAQALVEAGVGARLQREGLVHHGIKLNFSGQTHRIDLSELTGGRAVTVYGQHEVVKDLIEARLSSGGDLRFAASDVQISGIDGDAPRIAFTQDGQRREIACEFVAGCDGFHGVSRGYVPAPQHRIYERSYPFAWLGILAAARPASEELVYARHANGFALLSMRSVDITRAYLQCAPDEDLAQWSDARIWEELHRRLEVGGGFRVTEGAILQRGVTPMRSFVIEPMQYRRLFLVGDAAHILPPTGAKGMNLAIADVRVLSRALAHYFRSGKTDLLDTYSATCLRRVWQVQRFSWWMTALMHRFPDADAFGERLRDAELSNVVGSRAASQSLAENYVGLLYDI
jgi:p-hydroxybenzoate 3-monooxygenase